MKLQVKVKGKINGVNKISSRNGSTITVYGNIQGVEFHNDACKDSYYFVNGKYPSISLSGKGMEFYQFDEEVVITGDITEFLLKDSKGQTVKEYYIPECVIQLIDVDEEPEDELFH